MENAEARIEELEAKLEASEFYGAKLEEMVSALITMGNGIGETMKSIDYNIKKLTELQGCMISRMH